MTPEMTDARGRRNPSAWRAWARARVVDLTIDNRKTHGGLNARMRRRARRASMRKT